MLGKGRFRWASMLALMTACAASAVWAQVCTVTPIACDDEAVVEAPAGGFCLATREFCFATISAYDASGNLVDSDTARCRPCR